MKYKGLAIQGVMTIASIKLAELDFRMLEGEVQTLKD